MQILTLQRNYFKTDSWTFTKPAHALKYDAGVGDVIADNNQLR
jgi:hypothetical protein